MVNRLYNKQVSPKGYKTGGSTTFKDLKKKGVISDNVKVKEFNKLKKIFSRGKK